MTLAQAPSFLCYPVVSPDREVLCLGNESHVSWDDTTTPQHGTCTQHVPGFYFMQGQAPAGCSTWLLQWPARRDQLQPWEISSLDISTSFNLFGGHKQQLASSNFSKISKEVKCLHLWHSAPFCCHFCKHNNSFTIFLYNYQLPLRKW